MATFRCVHRKADEGAIPGRIPTEENAARCVHGRREASRDFPSRALDVAARGSDYVAHDKEQLAAVTAHGLEVSTLDPHPDRR